MTTDVQLNTDNGYFDISWTDSGDIATAQSLDTAILMSIFEEARATPAEVPAAPLRRGWLGNEFADLEQGSKLWEFTHERVTATMLSELGVVIQNAMSWMVDTHVAERVAVSSPTYQSGAVSIGIEWVYQGDAGNQYFTLWGATGPGLDFERR
jgi:phage gp46-like protein